MAQSEMVIFTRTFDFLTWLLPLTNHFPRAHRQTATKRLLDAAFDLREHLESANLKRGHDRAQRLDAADDALARVEWRGNRPTNGRLEIGPDLNDEGVWWR